MFNCWNILFVSIFHFLLKCFENESSLGVFEKVMLEGIIFPSISVFDLAGPRGELISNVSINY